MVRAIPCFMKLWSIYILVQASQLRQSREVFLFLTFVDIHVLDIYKFPWVRNTFYTHYCTRSMGCCWFYEKSRLQNITIFKSLCFPARTKAKHIDYFQPQDISTNKEGWKICCIFDLLAELSLHRYILLSDSDNYSVFFRFFYFWSAQQFC